MSSLYAFKDHFKESQLYLNRAITAIVIISILITVLIGRLMVLQIFQYDLYKTLSLYNQVRILPIVPKRGLIFDRNGILLAENVPVFSLEITPERAPDIKETLKAISDIMPLSDTEQRQFYKQMKYKKRNEGIPIRVKLTEAEVAKLSIEKHHLPGVDIVAQLMRSYPLGEPLAHALGYVGPISEKDQSEINPADYRGTYTIGKIGIEKFYEKALHGKVGYHHVETDAKGRAIRSLNRLAPIPGANLYLSIDSELQLACYEALKDLKGAIVAIDPNNGEVLALVSKPSFDPNLFAQGIDTKTYQALQNSPEKPLFNRSIRGQYPPGSTIKPLVALQGLETHTITPEFKLFDPGWFQLTQGGRLYRDWIFSSKRHGHGWVDLDKAMSQSCDTYFFTLANRLGADQLHNIYHRFGLGQKTNVDMTNEAKGLNPSPAWKKQVYNEAWYSGDTLNIGIGQGTLLATPLQMAEVAAALAKQGEWFEPHLGVTLEKEENEENANDTANESIETLPIQAKPVIELNNKEHWKIIQNAMKQVVHTPGGTAHRISQGIEYTIAGKTGTSQVFNLKQNEKYEVNRVKAHLRDHSWFIGYAPVEKPTIAIAVLIENKQTKSGTDIARIVFDSFFKAKHKQETSDLEGEDEDHSGGAELSE